jgi:hypothetical protein
MPVAREASGTITTSTFEQTINATTTAKTRQLVLDTTNMLNGDVIEIRARRKVLATGTVRTAMQVWTIGPIAPSTNPVWTSPPVASPDGVTWTIKRVAGGDRSYDWSVETLD